MPAKEKKRPFDKTPSGYPDEEKEKRLQRKIRRTAWLTGATQDETQHALRVALPGHGRKGKTYAWLNEDTPTVAQSLGQKRAVELGIEDGKLAEELRVGKYDKSKENGGPKTLLVTYKEVRSAFNMTKTAFRELLQSSGCNEERIRAAMGSDYYDPAAPTASSSSATTSGPQHDRRKKCQPSADDEVIVIEDDDDPPDGKQKGKALTRPRPNQQADTAPMPGKKGRVAPTKPRKRAADDDTSVQENEPAKKKLKPNARRPSASAKTAKSAKSAASLRDKPTDLDDDDDEANIPADELQEMMDFLSDGGNDNNDADGKVNGKADAGNVEVQYTAEEILEMEDFFNDNNDEAPSDENAGNAEVQYTAEEILEMEDFFNDNNDEAPSNEDAGNAEVQYTAEEILEMELFLADDADESEDANREDETKPQKDADKADNTHETSSHPDLAPQSPIFNLAEFVGDLAYIGNHGLTFSEAEMLDMESVLATRQEADGHDISTPAADRAGSSEAAVPNSIEADTEDGSIFSHHDDDDLFSVTSTKSDIGSLFGDDAKGSESDVLDEDRSDYHSDAEKLPQDCTKESEDDNDEDLFGAVSSTDELDSLFGDHANPDDNTAHNEGHS
ncbi:hypothetical protein GGR50DRAFT_696432 [Xylaria sp. CBS 124048]|nr:hypothetical protein GGR50DRAFT_696432 [Xylaria sp. CBS 124048]